MEQIAGEMQKQMEEKGFCYVDDLKDADPAFGAPVESLVESVSVLGEFTDWAKAQNPSSPLSAMVPISACDEIAFLCSSSLFTKCIDLFQETSEKLAIDRVKRGKKPAALELQM